MSFLALDRSILTSSIWCESDSVLRLWIYLLLSADSRTGIVAETEPAMALRCAMKRDELTAALKVLSGPDQCSRTKANEGRRIVIADDGIHILNYARYRDKDHSATRTARWRERRRATVGDASVTDVTVGDASVTDVTVGDGCVTQDKDKDKDIGGSIPPIPPSTSSPPAPGDEGVAVLRRPPAVPWHEFVLAFNAVAGRAGWRAMNGEATSRERKRALSVRSRDPYWRDHWREALARAESWPWGKGENDRGWRVDADWFLRPGQVERIVEGKCDSSSGYVERDETLDPGYGIDRSATR